MYDYAWRRAEMDREQCGSRRLNEGGSRMNAIAKEERTSQDFAQLKNRHKTTWMTGDCDLVSRLMKKDAVQFFQRLRVTPGTRLLDAGCGAGELAPNAARVTWGACTELNASHAQDQAGVTKAATLELLRRNSPNPAAAVR